MEAIILAAGLGTRLRPLTDDRPKALVEVAGIPMLERVARSLVDAGIRRIVVNTHHHAERIEAFIERRGGFGVDVLISREEGDAPLETGGGIKQAAGYLELSGPVLVHNVDVITDMDLRALVAAHAPQAVATLAVSDAETRSPLLVDAAGVVGVRYPSGGEERAREARGGVRAAAFCGVSVLSPALPSLIEETGAFSMIPVYLRLIAEGREVHTHHIADAHWIDIGTHERLAEANSVLEGTTG